MKHSYSTPNWLDEKLLAYKENPKAALENMLSATTDTIEQYINSPSSMETKKLLDICLQHNKLFLHKIGILEDFKTTIQSVADKLGLVFVEKEKDFAGRYYFMSLKTIDGQYVSYNPCEENKETGEYSYLDSHYNAIFDDLVPEMANDKWNILAVIYGDDEETTYEDAVKEFAEWLEKLNNLGVVVAPFLSSDQKGGFVTRYALKLG